MTLIQNPTKLFTVVVPTLGRDTLWTTLDSIASHSELCEIIIVADSFEMSDEKLTEIEDVANQYEAEYYEVNAGHHDWGSPQLQLGYKKAKGLYILNCGDDDIYEPYAFETIKYVLDMNFEVVPMMFRTVLHPSPVRGNEVPVVLWHLPALINKNITGQCLLLPNDQSKIGSWSDLVDYGFICTSIDKWDGKIVWRPEVISQCY